MTRAPVVLALDYSVALALHELWPAAKELATASAGLLEQQGHVKLMAHSELAKVLTAEELADLSWDFIAEAIFMPPSNWREIGLTSLLRPDSPVRDIAQRMADMTGGSVWAYAGEDPITTTVERFASSIGLF